MVGLQGPVLTQFSQLADDSIAVIWTMVERHDEESPRAPFWRSLPDQLHSGFSMSDRLLQTLEGTPAYAEICTSRKVSASVSCALCLAHGRCTLLDAQALVLPLLPAKPFLCDKCMVSKRLCFDI